MIINKNECMSLTHKVSFFHISYLLFNYVSELLRLLVLPYKVYLWTRLCKNMFVFIYGFMIILLLWEFRRLKRCIQARILLKLFLFITYTILSLCLYICLFISIDLRNIYQLLLKWISKSIQSFRFDYLQSNAIFKYCIF